jgi:hypothetical protein
VIVAAEIVGLSPRQVKVCIEIIYPQGPVGRDEESDGDQPALQRSIHPTAVKFCD